MRGSAALPGTKPVVSIGMPVYNGERDLARALDSLLAQSFADFELIISDNASVDATGDICAAYAQLDHRVQHIRQQGNIGAAANFRYVLEAAGGEFFMWAAADDTWRPDFISANVAALRENSRRVASISRVHMQLPTHKDARFVGSFPLSGSFSEKLCAYLTEPGQNSRFYSLFKREQLLAAFVRRAFVGADWAIVVNLLRLGDFHEVDEILMERASDGESSQLHATEESGMSRVKNSWVLRDFSCWLWSNVGVRDFLACFPQLTSLNARFTFVRLFGSR